jgi:hypothetical protein
MGITTITFDVRRSAADAVVTDDEATIAPEAIGAVALPEI